MSSPCRLPVSTVRSTDTPNLGPQSPNQCVPETGNTEEGRDLTSSPAMAPQFRVLLLMKAEPRALGSLPVLSHPPSALWVLPTGLLPLPGLQLSQVRPPCDYRVLHMSSSWGALVGLSGLGSHFNASSRALDVPSLLTRGSVAGGSSTDSNSVLEPDLLWTNLPEAGSLP